MSNFQGALPGENTATIRFRKCRIYPESRLKMHHRLDQILTPILFAVSGRSAIWLSYF